MDNHQNSGCPRYRIGDEMSKTYGNYMIHSKVAAVETGNKHNRVTYELWCADKTIVKEEK